MNINLEDYETRMVHDGKRNNREVKIICELCGNETWQRWQRVKQKIKDNCKFFCSIECANRARSEEDSIHLGKENAGVVFDKTKDAYYVYWIDPDTQKRRTTTYARWWYELNVGEIPDGYRASYKDGNPKNISPENIIIISSEEFGVNISKILMGHNVSHETRKKIAIGHTGKDEWDGFIYDGRYPGFSKQLKQRIKRRDKFTCQICGENLKGTRRSRVHHIDGDKKNPNLDNLVLLCIDCHSAIHCRKEVDDKIQSFRSLLNS